MNEDLLERVNEGSIYSQKMIVVSSFFGGVFAGSYMIYKNFKTFGEDSKARITIIITILIFIFLVSTAFVPALEKIPSFLFTLFFTFFNSLLTNKFQGHTINKMINEGCKTYSTGNAVAVCLVNLLVIAAMIFGAFYLQDVFIKKEI